MQFTGKFPDKYKYLNSYVMPIKMPVAQIIGRETEIDRLMAAMMRPEVSNVILLAPAGSGKTALVQEAMRQDNDRYYVEVNLSHMISDLNDVNQMADRLKSLFDEVQSYCKETHQQLVLFMDEFHQVVQLSPAAVEALKPMLADSGTRGIHVVAATTFIEFRQFIAPNQPLVERLMRINLEAPSKQMVVEILRKRASLYGVDQHFYDNHLFEKIYEYTNRYVPANAQPRKSILVFDAMIGWYRAKRRRLDERLLADVIYESEGVNVAFRVDPTSIKRQLDAKVFAQDFATRTIAKRLQICVADLNDKTKPMSSFLFTGSTGTGKMLCDDEFIPVYDATGSVSMKRNGDMKVGDYVFDRKGSPTRVIGVYPQGVKDIYVVELMDGRKIRAGDGHLWTYRSAFGNGAKTWRTATTVELMDKLGEENDKRRVRFVIPANQAVEWPRRSYSQNIYEVGYRASKNNKPVDKAYIYGSVSQRCTLVQGLFDRNGHISRANKRYDLVYRTSNEELARQVLWILRSLGIHCAMAKPHGNMFAVRVYVANEEKASFFMVSTKQLDAAKEAAAFGNRRRANVDAIGIRRIYKTNETSSMTCIEVENSESLYQAGEFIVTHNTEVTKQLARILFNDEKRLIRFDMTEYANADSLNYFRKELTARVWERPYSIILLDEVEKACAPVTRILLQVLDDGRLSDENGREVPFINSYIVMTTNAGSEIYKDIAQYGEDDRGSGEILKRYEKLIRESISSTTGANRFPPELLGRIDAIVPFQPLSEATQTRIITSKLYDLKREVMEKHGVHVDINRAVVDYIVKDNLDTNSDSGGARAAISKLESEVVTAVAAFVNTYKEVDHIIVSVDGDMAYKNKTMLESNAMIKVVPAVASPVQR